MSERLFNAVFYAIRRTIRWSRPIYRPRNEDKYPFFEAKPHLLYEADRLERAYHLQGFRTDSTSIEYRESLYVVDLLDRLCPPDRLPERLQALDVGSRNFAYARGLYHFLRHAGGHPSRKVDLTGIEVDPFQIYTDLRSRIDHARYHLRGLPAVRFVDGDVVTHEGRYDLITWFLPFVTEYAHRKWGLPSRLFYPDRALRHVYGLLAEEGLLIIANREEEERDLQLRLLESLGISARPPVRHESDWMAVAPRYVTIVEK